MHRNGLYAFIRWSFILLIFSKLSFEKVNAQPRAARSASSRQAALRKSADGLYTIENSQVRVGINTNYGASITYLAFMNDQNGKVSTQNMINNFDLGRQSQIAIYSGPLDYSKNGAGNWINLGWNPIQAGSTYGDVSQVVTVEKQDNQLYAKTIPKQFALRNEPGEAYIEHWIHLEGNVVKVHAKVTMFRSDKAQYFGRQQEFPCLYTNGDYHNIWAYKGGSPYTNSPLDVTRIAPPQNMFYDDAFPTEPWMATTNDNGYGVGLYSPDNTDFKKGYFGTDVSGDEFSPTAAYVGATNHIILDHDIVYEWDYAYILGNLDQIRSYVYRQPHMANGPNFVFDTSRKGWYYEQAHDTGWRVDNKLHVIFDDAQHARITSPYVFWKGRDNPKIYIRAAFNTQTDTFRFNWRRADDRYMYGSSDRLVEFPVINDGQYHTYEIDLSGNLNWLDQNIAQIEFSPITSSSSPGTWVEFAWVSNTPEQPVATNPTTPTPTEPPVVTNPVKPVEPPVATNPVQPTNPINAGPLVVTNPTVATLCVSGCVPLQIKKVR